MAERGCLSINFDLSALLFLPDPDPKQMIPNQDPGKSSGPDRIRIQNTGFDQVGNTSSPKNTEVKQLGPQLAFIQGLNVDSGYCSCKYCKISGAEKQGLQYMHLEQQQQKSK